MATTQPMLSCGQLYQLFGFRKKLDFDAIIDELLYSISEIKYSDAPISNYSCLSGDLLNASAMPVIPYRVFEKEKLPEYLDYKSSRMFLRRIEVRLRAIMRKKAEIKALRWYNFSKLFKLYTELHKLSSLTVPVKDVFSFFGHRAKKVGISLEKLHTRMKKAAEVYEPNSLFA